MVETFTPGTLFAGYRIERQLGAGGMGVVYLARHPRLPRLDAIKVLPPNFSAAAEFRARFLREAELAAQLDHRNIVAVHDRGTEDGRLWIAMEFVDGVDAAELLRRTGALPGERVVTLVRDVARGLDEAHRSGMLHRDVKPANILIESGAEDAERVLIADFGIARAAGEGTALTEVGTVMGTLAYTAPEVLAEGQVDHRADVYALGCTVFELLTGRKPFPRDSVVAVITAHLEEPPPRVRELRPELPPKIDAVIARAMAKNPDDRQSSCGALAAAVADAFGHAVEPTLLVARPPSIPSSARDRTGPDLPETAPSPRRPSTRRPSARRARIAAVAAGILAVVTAVTSVVVLQHGSKRTASPPVPTTTTAAGVTWGKYKFVVDALPTLLPATPVATGYQGIRCAAVEDDSGREADLKKLPRTIARIDCTGNRNPVSDVDVRCSTNRTPFFLADEHPIGNEQWVRSSGRGRVDWLDVDEGGQRRGVVGLEFEEPTRNFCQVAIIGGTSGQDLHDRWWPNAPF
ncbi:serine/threonine-protein kinase [Nocardia sp. CDC160]|uniref:serine/threonine-protein kinase n=1 Tax=Nocardia sp. CDC160 TaxID=3112166 RepID=UPI002DBB8C85|nr:serine/threonine-protein kinase [Nocardia sp. CDC160]MEC3917819.1 serine/threonine-protein kinase [Nocardia sp. CDC160]